MTKKSSGFQDWSQTNLQKVSSDILIFVNTLVPCDEIGWNIDGNVSQVL